MDICRVLNDLPTAKRRLATRLIRELAEKKDKNANAPAYADTRREEADTFDSAHAEPDVEGESVGEDVAALAEAESLAEATLQHVESVTEGALAELESAPEDAPGDMGADVAALAEAEDIAEDA